MKAKTIIAVLSILGYSINSQGQQYVVSAGNDITIKLGSKGQLHASIKSSNGQEITPICGKKIEQTKPFESPTSCADCNKTISTTANWLSVSSNDKIFVPSGLSSVNATIDGGTLIICGSNTNVQLNFNKGKLIVYGSIIIDNLNMNTSACTIENYGSIQVNYYNSLGNVFNYGRLLVSNYANINGGLVSNFGEMQFKKSITVNSAKFQNDGSVTVTGTASINGNSALENTCSLTSGELSKNGSINNQGIISTSGGTLSSSGIRIVWTPAQDLDNPLILTPFASPSKNTEYIISAYNSSNQIIGSDKTTVFVKLPDNSSYGELDHKPYPKVSMNDLHLLQLYLLGLTKESDLQADFAIAADVAPPYSVIDMSDFTALKMYIMNPAKYPLPVTIN